MAGEALTNAFMLGTATVMLGPVADLYSLNVASHSVGLVKNVTSKSSPAFTELTQGVKNTLVFSVQTSNDVMVSGELYEYTSKNIAYGLALDGSGFAAKSAKGTVNTAIAAPTPPALTAAVLAMTAAPTGDLATPGGYVMVQIGNDDQAFIRKIVTVSASNLTLDRGFPIAIPVGTNVKAVNVVGIGKQEDAPFLSCKIVGTIADGSEIVILLPKVRITSGISLAFKTDGYDFIPFELKVYDLVATDPYYADFAGIGKGLIATVN